MKTDKLNGKWTKLLKAFAVMFGLEHVVEVGDNYVRVDVFVKNEWYESILDVFEEGKVACVSSMSKFIFGSEKPLEDAVESTSKEILEGTFGERRYLESFKGGGCKIIGGQLVEVPYFTVKDLPRNLDELLIRLDLAGIDPKNVVVEPKESERTT